MATGTGSVSRSSIDPGDARTYIVNLTGVANAQTLTVSLANVNDSVGNSSASVSASVGFLLGDVNQTRAVDGNDAATRGRHELQSRREHQRYRGWQRCLHSAGKDADSTGRKGSRRAYSTIVRREKGRHRHRLVAVSNVGNR